MAETLPPDTLAHVRRLDAAWARLLRGERAPPPLSVVRRAALPATDGEWALLYAGGGLGLLHAAALAPHVPSILLFDPRPVGSTHREWNISRPELAALARVGLLDAPSEARIIAREYRRGLLRFHHPSAPPTEVALPGVLDVAVDASALLAHARARLEAAGGSVWQGASFEHVWLASDGPPRVVVRLRDGAGHVRHVGARLLVNAMGALSPLSLALAGPGLPLHGVCPTVGSVAHGFAPGEVDPTVGEILVTLEGARAGRQLIWEGFPAGGDRFTTYLFYYDVTAGRAASPHSLEALFADYFRLLPSYKQPGADFAHCKPVYGFIPAQHHSDAPPAQRARTARALLSIGDAAARQNPLTFTGFGSFVRHLPGSVAGLVECLREDDLEAERLAALSAEQANLSAMWVMARFLAPRRDPDAVNAIFRAFSRALAEVEPAQAAAFFLDQATWGSYVELMLRVARQRPQVLAEAVSVLGPRGVAQWLEDLARWRAAGG